MISKKLLSEIIHSSVTRVRYKSENEIEYNRACDLPHIFKTINIYELALHLCKEWALANGYWIDSNVGFVSIGKNGNKSVVKSFNGYDLKRNEPNLIIDACEWILDTDKLIAVTIGYDFDTGV